MCEDLITKVPSQTQAIFTDFATQVRSWQNFYLMFEAMR
jgi:hypothetical protein